MCYTGGPRCSSHVEQQLSAATTEFAVKGNSPEGMKCYEKMNVLQMEYNSTPRGQELLRQEIKALRNEKNTPQAEALESQLSAAIALRDHDMEQRALRLAAGKSLDRSCGLGPESASETKRINEQNRAHGLEEITAPVKQKKDNNLVEVEIGTVAYSDYDSSLVPQANDIDKVSSIVEAVNSGANTATSIGESLESDNRGGNYYANAAEYLGLVTKHESAYDGGYEYELTENGKTVLEGSAEDRARHIRNMVNSTPLQDVYYNSGRDKNTLTQHIMDLGYEEQTARRRASVVASWDQAVNSESFVKQMGDTHKATAARSLAAAEKLQSARKDKQLKSVENPTEAKREACTKCWTLKPLSGVCDNCD